MCVQFVLASSRGIRQLVFLFFFPLNIVYLSGLNQCECNSVEKLILDRVPQPEWRDIT